MIEAGGNRVRVLDALGTCYAYAYRSRPGNLWWIHERNRKGELRCVARVNGRQPEVRQRKMVLALMKEMQR